MEQILLFAGIGIVVSLAVTITVLKIIASKSLRWIIYSCLILIGVGILFIWPPESNNGRMKIHDAETALGFALIFPTILTLIVQSFINDSKKLRQNVINKATAIAKEFNLEIVGLPDSTDKRQLMDVNIWYKGTLNNTWNFHLSSHLEVVFSPTVPYDKRKRYHYKKIVLAVPSNPEFCGRIVATSNQLDVPKLEKNLTPFVSNNDRFDEDFTILSSNQSSLVHFFQKYEIQQLLVANKKNLSGFIDLNLSENLISLSFKERTYTEGSIFSSNLQEKIIAHEIEELKIVFEFLKKFLNEWEKLN